MTNIIELKMQIMKALKEKYPSLRQVRRDQYCMRCPVCGDSQTDMKATHFYLKCDMQSYEPILYKCFKGNCNAKGRIDASFLRQYGIEIPGMDSLSSQRYNKIGSFKVTDTEILCGEPRMNSNQVRYIEHRLGTGFTIDDYAKFKIIWDEEEFRKYIPQNIIVPDNRSHISFLSTDKSMLLSRTFNENGSHTWIKTELFKSDNIRDYTISSQIDLTTNGDITVNMAEGIFDVLSAYKNFNTGENSMYVAMLGASYDSAIQGIISRGIFGGNVILNIYADNDIPLKSLRNQTTKYKWLFKYIKLLINTFDKDIGTTRDRFILREILI